MATKTISIDIEAYERLANARNAPTESFSKVIKRAVWPDETRTAGALLEVMASVSPLPEEALERLERAQADDVPPEDPWQSG